MSPAAVSIVAWMGLGIPAAILAEQPLPREYVLHASRLIKDGYALQGNCFAGCSAGAPALAKAQPPNHSQADQHESKANCRLIFVILPVLSP